MTQGSDDQAARLACRAGGSKWRALPLYTCGLIALADRIIPKPGAPSPCGWHETGIDQAPRVRFHLGFVSFPMSAPSSPPVGDPGATAPQDASAANDVADRPPAAPPPSDLDVPKTPPVGDGPLAHAEAELAGLPVHPARLRRTTGPLETVSWVEESTKRGPLSLLRDKLFWITVLLPTLISGLYFGLIASDIYISESRFVVRTPQRAQQPGLMGALLQGTGFSRAQDDALTVHDFIQSRDALRELDDKHKVRVAYSAETVDPINRFPGLWGDDSFESLYKYYAKQVGVEYDANSSITTLRVSAFSAADAHDINASLLAMGERLVNQINERGRNDLVRFAQAEVAEAEAKAKAAALAVAAYRNQRAVFDPERQSALQLQQVSKLQDELIATRIQLGQIQALSPQNPQIPTLQKRAKGLEQEMAAEMAKVAGGGAGNTLSNKAADFERLTLERAFADRQVASALTSLENARNEARRQQLYLERIVQPNMPDYALEPRRARNVVATFLLGLISWGILSMLLAGVKEHQA